MVAIKRYPFSPSCDLQGSFDIIIVFYVCYYINYFIDLFWLIIDINTVIA